jgi:hypothetical protein
MTAWVSRVFVINIMKIPKFFKRKRNIAIIILIIVIVGAVYIFANTGMVATRW